MLPDTIDGIVDRLKGIVSDAIREGDRRGYFAALYLRVTEAVRDGIAAGRFDDGPRMERLDVTFARRYLDAYDRFRGGELPSRAWLLAFEAAERSDLAVLQHLMLGMNAHITLDLGVAAARTCPGAQLPPLAGDFDRINDVLASLTPVVEHELDGTSRVFRVLTRIAPKLELKVVGFDMLEARKLAWDLAVELAPLAPEAQVPAIARRDAAAVLLADAVLAPDPILMAMRLTEGHDVAANIRLLAQGEFAPAGRTSAG